MPLLWPRCHTPCPSMLAYALLWCSPPRVPAAGCMPGMHAHVRCQATLGAQIADKMATFKAKVSGEASGLGGKVQGE